MDTVTLFIAIAIFLLSFSYHAIKIAEDGMFISSIVIDAAMLAYMSVFLLFWFIFMAQVTEASERSSWVHVTLLFLVLDSFFTSLQVSGNIFWFKNYNEPPQLYPKEVEWVLQTILFLSAISTFVVIAEPSIFPEYIILNIAMFSLRVFYFLIAPLV